MRRSPELAVIVPAHDEEATIGACLESLLVQDFRGGVELVVVANGCADRTAAVARAYGRAAAARGWRLDVREISRASKSAALNTGDAAARFGDRVYIDADVELSPSALTDIADAFAGGVSFCSPRINAIARSPAARVYGRVWTRLPYVAGEVIGAGVFAVSSGGRRRWGAFPDIVADDKFARLHFAAAERRVLTSSSFDLHLPYGLRELVRVRSRWIRANTELRRQFPALAATDRRRLDRLVGFAFRHPGLWRDMVGFAAIYACAELRAAAVQLHGRPCEWERAGRARELRR